MLDTEVKKRAEKHELDKLKLEISKYVDKEVDRLERVVQSSVDGVKIDLDNLRREFEAFKNNDFKKLQDRVTALEKRLKELAAQLARHIDECQGGNRGNNTADLEALQNLANRMDHVEQKINDNENNFARWYKDLKDELNQKVDISALHELEKLLLDRQNELTKALTKQFADKGETKKALKILERQMKNLFDVYLSKGMNNNEEDAMFSKKPLQGLSCASCEKDLINMYGKRVEFMPWSKLPFRDPADRLARVGQGFSKMLSMINPDHLSQAGSKMQHVSHTM